MTVAGNKGGLSRRDGIRVMTAGLVTTAVISAVSQPVAAQNSKRTFVLVHGAWHGGWCYGRVAKLLRERGHTVFTPTLAGLGEHSHLFSGNIDLFTHVTDVLNVIKWEGLENIVLCGHSYGGMVITGVAAAAADKIAAIVYLDAFLPGDNQSLFDLAGPEALQGQMASASTLGGIGLSPIPAAAFGVNEKDRAWVDSLCTIHPIATFIEKNKSAAGLEAIKRKHYIFATGYMNGGLFKWAYDKVKDNAVWTKEVVSCGHDVMVDQPEHVAESLEKVAA
jgi:pimeloyl-ACP methyl ester carboxylesterase